VNDSFDDHTEKMVVQVQRWNNLEQDGIVGTNTWRVVDAYATQ
jgi:peptidoglycan hydrolase-like protein with peptidoglycan-binding domain